MTAMTTFGLVAAWVCFQVRAGIRQRPKPIFAPPRAPAAFYVVLGTILPDFDRFGLEDGKRKSLRQIADIVRTSQSYVRRVEGTAMRKLRSPEQQRRLRDFSNSSSGGRSSLSPPRSSVPATSAATSWEELLAAATVASNHQNRNRGGGRRARRGGSARRSAVSSR